MANIDWHTIMNGNRSQNNPYKGCNVKFFNAYVENREKSMKEGRPIFDEIPSVSIHWPGMDETVRRIEPHDIQTWPELYAAFTAGKEAPTSGTPLTEWAALPGSVVKELQHLGFKTIEQLADASDEMKRRLGTAAQFVKKAKEWIGAANSTQNQVVALKEQLEREKARTTKLAEQVELLLQRIEGSEGTDLRSARKEVIQSSYDDLAEDDEIEEEVEEVRPVRRGRPRKV